MRAYSLRARGSHSYPMMALALLGMWLGSACSYAAGTSAEAAPAWPTERSVLDKAMDSAGKIKQPLQRAVAHAECAQAIGHSDKEVAKSLLVRAQSAIDDAKKRPSVGQQLIAAITAALPGYIISMYDSQSPYGYGSKMKFDVGDFAGMVGMEMLWQESPQLAARLQVSRSAEALRRIGPKDNVMQLVAGWQFAQSVQAEMEIPAKMTGIQKSKADALVQASTFVLVAHSALDPGADAPAVAAIPDLEYRRVALMNLVSNLPRLTPEVRLQSCNLIPECIAATDSKGRALEELCAALKEAADSDVECVATIGEQATDPMMQSAACQSAALKLGASDPARATRLFESAIGSSLKITDNEVREYLAVRSIEGLAGTNASKAYSSAGGSADPHTRALANWAIAGQVGKSSKTEAANALKEAAMWAGKIDDPKLRVLTLLEISTAMGGVDPASSAQVFDGAVREISAVKDESAQIIVLDSARTSMESLRESGTANVGIASDAVQARVESLRTAISAAKQINDPRERCVALWKSTAELSKWSAAESLPLFDEAEQVFEKEVLPRYASVDVDNPELAEKAAQHDLWLVLRIAARDLAPISRERADRIFQSALKTANEMTIYVPAKPLRYGLWGLVKSDVDPRLARGYATIMTAAQMAWMDPAGATKLIDAAELPKPKAKGLLGVGTAIGGGMAKLLYGMKEAGDTTQGARASAYLDMTMMAASNRPDQAAGYYEKAMDALISSKYDWRAIWFGVSACAKIASHEDLTGKEEKCICAVPVLWTSFYPDEPAFCQRVLSGLYAVAQTPSWKDAETQGRLVRKTVDLLGVAVSDYPRVGALCSVSSLLRGQPAQAH